MSIDPYVAVAALLFWAGLVLTVIALFIGRDRMIDDLRKRGQ